MITLNLQYNHIGAEGAQHLAHTHVKLKRTLDASGRVYKRVRMRLTLISSLKRVKTRYADASRRVESSRRI